MPQAPSLLWLLPFAAQLLAIALLPLGAPHWWESNLRKLALSAALSIPVLAFYGIHQPEALAHTAREYFSFVVVLAGLFVVAGGVLLEGDLEATPTTNLALLATGGILASVIGTTGASMLLIRPLLSTNQQRRHVAHTVVFFIFIVSNIGGCLTPLGDPPLFLGYLRGVPFTWTLRLFPEWLFTSLALLGIYAVWDTRLYRREPPERVRLDRQQVRPLTIAGSHNLGLLVLLIAAIAWLQSPWRELAVAVVALLSWRFTSPRIHIDNRLSLHPIAEVAAIFAGIFVTMLPALDVLAAYSDRMTLSTPWHYFWTTGTLSAWLDNAPTYLTFLTLAQSQGLTNEVVGIPHDVLTGISLGAVMMGAMTYIGNAPNLMVRSVAESQGVRMPSFGGFLLYSGAVLLPLFLILSLLFLRC